MTLEKLIVA